MNTYNFSYILAVLSYGECSTLTTSLRTALDKAVADGAHIAPVVARSLGRLERLLARSGAARVQPRPRARKLAGVTGRALRSAWRALRSQLGVWRSVEAQGSGRTVADLVERTVGDTSQAKFLAGNPAQTFDGSTRMLERLDAEGAVAFFASRGASAVLDQVRDAQAALGRELGVKATLHPAGAANEADSRGALRDVRAAAQEYVQRVQYAVACPDCEGSEDLAVRLTEPFRVLARARAEAPKKPRATKAPKAAKAMPVVAAAPAPAADLDRTG